MNILIELLRSGKGESGSECCNEFINFPHKCQQLQRSFNCHRAASSLNSGVARLFYSSLFFYLPFVLDSLQQTIHLVCPIFRKPNFIPQNTTPQLTASNSPGVDYKFSIIFSVLDASGRYSSQFLWGNSYWLGSFTLCQQLHFNSRQEGSAPPFPGAYSVVSLRVNVTGFTTPHVRKCLYRNTSNRKSK